MGRVPLVIPSREDSESDQIEEVSAEMAYLGEGEMIAG